MSSILESLQTALDMEQKGREFYLDAADKVTDSVVVEVLVALANDEAEHERMIERYYNAMHNHAGWPEMPKESVGEAITPAVEMLSKTVGEIGAHASYQSVYATACELEKRSRDFYIKCKDEAEDKQVAEFFAFLVRVEQAHLDALQLMLYASR